MRVTFIGGSPAQKSSLADVVGRPWMPTHLLTGTKPLSDQTSTEK
ncbi:MAG TPA: hypothetical protein VJ852_13665 [Gemmatimonadaceae bacterium]|nr:hypothetical protein [Gemmatimonadaceae bacterium]